MVEVLDPCPSLCGGLYTDFLEVIAQTLLIHCLVFVNWTQ